MDKVCSACHNGINIGGGMYAPFGVVEKPAAEFLPPRDKGRLMVTKTPSDEYVFKVPTDVDTITAFLETLTGPQPKVTYPILPPSVASTPRPQP